MAAYYNENDPKAAAWLRELIRQQLIADGEVDTRSIVDVRPDDLRGFVQCHFFAGIGGWSYALRLAGWPDDRGVWTGSCPCQPFSMAGAGQGTDDPRHLWPAWFRLIEVCRPATIFGEQVASTDGLYWIDLVYVDLEAAGYALGSFDLCAASVGAPHIRQRLWIVADADGRQQSYGDIQRSRRHDEQPEDAPACVMADAKGARGRPDIGAIRSGSPEGIREPEGQDIGRAVREAGRACSGRTTGNVADANARGQRIDWATAGNGYQGGKSHVDEHGEAGELGHADASGREARDGIAVRVESRSAQSANPSHWRNTEWLICTDGAARPVEPGTFPLAHGLPARVGRLRGYGNAIVPQVAAEVIGAYMDICTDEERRDD